MINFPFKLFYGVIESIDDPKEANRVQVRCYAFHTESKTYIPTEKLPWATVSNPTTTAGVSGIGCTPHGLVKGSEVWGFFRDGEYCQDPVVAGSFSGIPANPANPNKGFSDPSGEFPRYTEESDVNRLARGVGVDQTIVKAKKEGAEKGVQSAGGVSWDEPKTPYNAVYPHNKVIETPSGHIIEIDDSEGAERINIHHRSGTFTEFHPDGTLVRKCTANNYEIVAGEDNLLVKGNMSITVVGDANIKCKNANVECNKSFVKAVEEYLIETKLFKVIASTKALFETPMVEGTGEVKDNKRTMQGDRDIYNKHTHVETQSTTNPPTQQK